MHALKMKIGDASGRWFAFNWLIKVTMNVSWLWISHTWAISQSNRFSYFSNLMTCNGHRGTLMFFPRCCIQYLMKDPFVFDSHIQIHMFIHTTKASTKPQRWHSYWAFTMVHAFTTMETNILCKTSVNLTVT